VTHGVENGRFRVPHVDGDPGGAALENACNRRDFCRLVSPLVR
jgi:hypothetical protein